MTSFADARVLVHIGLPKTATTWLQQHVFARPESGFWAPLPPGASGKKQLKELGRPFYSHPDGRLIADDDFDAAALRKHFAAIDVPEGMVPIISNERLAGHLLSNAYDRTSLCRRIGQVLPNARIFMALREQNAMIMSSYMQYLKFGGWHGLDKFLSPPPDHRMPAFDLQALKYDRLIGHYQHEFGSERVLALPYELFVRDAAGYVARIAAFAGTQPPAGLPYDRRENLRHNHLTSYYLRWLTCINLSTAANAFFPRPFGAIGGKIVDRGLKIALGSLVPASLDGRVRQALERRITRTVGTEFAASNRLSSQLIGLDLGEFGYRV